MLGQAVVAVTTMLAGRFCPPYMVDRFEILPVLQKLKSKLGTFRALGKVESGPTATDLPAQRFRPKVDLHLRAVSQRHTFFNR